MLLSLVSVRGTDEEAVSEDERPVIAGLRMRWQTLPGPDGAEAAFGLWVLDDPDATLDAITQEEFDRNDERMPYFATIWASAESLVAAVLEGPRLDGQRVLDLGCGLGACGFAAARHGARVTFFDWEPRALEIVAASASRQQAPAGTFDFVVGDWRRPPPFGRFDLILGADVLYERRNAPAVAAFLARHLKPGAEAWIADPGRPQAGPFPALAEAEGLALVSQAILPPRAHATEITLLRLRHPASPQSGEHAGSTENGSSGTAGTSY
jgi:2-polyprenyl-3-methyl-5-hydroxy-6-metoxy-1,4-benzoquinol methylase